MQRYMEVQSSLEIRNFIRGEQNYPLKGVRTNAFKSMICIYIFFLSTKIYRKETQADQY